jgi:hypothetical protein
MVTDLLVGESILVFMSCACIGMSISLDVDPSTYDEIDMPMQNMTQLVIGVLIQMCDVFQEMRRI